MKIKFKYIILISIIYLFFAPLLIPIKFVVAENDDDLAIKDGNEYTYTIEKLNEEKYSEMSGYPVYALPIYGIFDGRNMKITIEYIYKAEDCWYAETEQLIYKTDLNKKPSEIILKIPMYVEDFSPGSPFIPINAEKFLKDWDDFTYNDDISVDGLEVKIEDTENDIEKTYIYQDNGILSSTVIKYKGEEIYRDVLNSGMISFGGFFLGFLVTVIICVVIITNRKLRGVNKN